MFRFLYIIFLSQYIPASAQSLLADKLTPVSFSLDNVLICVDDNDFAVVKKSAALLRDDISMVTGKKPDLVNKIPAGNNPIIIIGSIERSRLIKDLTGTKKINTSGLMNKWEAWRIQTLSNPSVSNRKMLIITGSDRRGTAFGVFELSRQIGVSPWYWWADVPVKKKKSIYIKANILNTDAPKVKYRGIFINDEAPALSNWSKEKFGGFNHHFYEKVFELMLRLKANYLWPAMWGNAFYDDDSLNIKSAEEFAIVIGTSHHEPLMRAHDEWRRYGNNKKWNYDSTEPGLKEFWRGGMQRATNEKIVSIGMRGDGDEPMSRETATALLERIVRDQRQIIEEVTGKPAAETPQLWALYKEVQDYYDKGMRVPDDVTLLLCDDNWGNIRRLPRLDEKPRKGGYGIYYHFDYVGGPRNYKWINTNHIPRVWEQMHLAWEYKAREIWIVNVGDIKPMEFPISFFLDYAWNPEKIGADDIQKYTEEWAASQFGKEHAKQIGEILSLYTKYNARRKPELLDAETYRLNSGEWGDVANNFIELKTKTNEVLAKLSGIYYPAYYQLVLHPVLASANLNVMYFAVAMNHFFAQANLPSANEFADHAKKLFEEDSILSKEYHELNYGKWNHMMSQTHIGYTYWQQPAKQVMPQLMYVPRESTDQKDLDLDLDTKKAAYPAGLKYPYFFERAGVVSIEANHFSRSHAQIPIRWKILPDHGRTGSAVTIFPVTAKSPQVPGNSSPILEYEFYTYSRDSFSVHCYFSPTLNLFNAPNGLQFAVSVDNENPQLLSLNKDDNKVRIWEKWVANNINIVISRHNISKPGKHILRFWAIDPAVVLQKIVLDFGGLKTDYLGPGETLVRNK